jgi:hypothetical protein
MSNRITLKHVQGSTKKWNNSCINDNVDERITLRWVFRKFDVGAWIGSIWLRIGTVGGHL